MLVPWVLKTLQPRLLVVKSTQLVAAAEQQLAPDQHQQQPEDTDADADAKQTAAAGAADAAAAAAAAAQQLGSLSLQPCDGFVANVAAWWQQLELQCCNPGSAAEPWFIAARAAGFSKNPMRYPQRFTATGVRICRPHNYDMQRGCLKHDSCPFDHAHCHHCLEPGHRAVDCSC
jgi:hypothetical protein